MSASLILSRGGSGLAGTMGVWLKSRAGAASVRDDVHQCRRESIALVLTLWFVEG
jgi:hypothetical protein